jgi:hypothetical protein
MSADVTDFAAGGSTVGGERSRAAACAPSSLAIARVDTVGDGSADAPTVRKLVTGAPEIGVDREHDESGEAYARRAFAIDQVRTEPPPTRARSGGLQLFNPDVSARCPPSESGAARG